MQQIFKLIIMKKKIFFSTLIIAVLLSSCAIKKSNVSQRSIPYVANKYMLTFNESDPKLVNIEAKITLQDSLLSMSENGPVPHRWPQYIKNLEITDKNGKSIRYQKRDSTAWFVDNAYNGKRINLHYDVKIDHEDKNWPGGIDGVAFVRDWGVMASGRALFITNGDENKNIEIYYKKSDNWKVSAPWEQKGENRYTATNQWKLLESLMFVGTHKEVNLKREEFTLTFVLGGNSILKNEESYTANATKVLDYYIDLMGGIPKSAPGNELSKAMVIINEGEQIDGEVIGDDISIFLNPNAAPQEQVFGWFLFAHEFFHLWNGKSLRFQDTSTDWFKEGITNYYTIKSLYNTQIVNEEAIKGVMNNLFYNRYINDSGLGSLAPADAASPLLKDNHWGLVYGGGLFAGLCMDMEIRHNTQNQKSLDDLMQFFYNNMAGTDASIANKDIIDKTNELGKTDFTPFMNSYIKGVKIVPLKEYLKFAGIEVSTQNKQLSLIHLKDKTLLQEQMWLGFLGIKI